MHHAATNTRMSCKACRLDRHRAAHAPDAWVPLRQALLVLRGIPDCVYIHLGNGQRSARM